MTSLSVYDILPSYDISVYDTLPMISLAMIVTAVVTVRGGGPARYRAELSSCSETSVVMRL